MSDTAPSGRRPSDRLDELRDQLLRELKKLGSEGGGEEPELFRAYLQHAQVLAWRGVAEGRMDTPRTILEALGAAEPFVYLHGSNPLSPAGSAALEVHFTLRSLQLAAEALEERRVEDRLADDRSETEREILRVLYENRGQYLRRGDIHERLRLEKKPTPARVGQVLVELHYEGLLMRIHGRAQGNPNAAFYALSPVGVDVCRNLELVPEPVWGSKKTALMEEAAAIALKTTNTPEERERQEIVTSQLVNESVGPRGPQVLETLKRVAQETAEASRYQAIYGEVQVARRLAVSREGATIQADSDVSGTQIYDPLSTQELSSLQRAREKEAQVGELVAVG